MYCPPAHNLQNWKSTFRLNTECSRYMGRAWKKTQFTSFQCMHSFGVKLIKLFRRSNFSVKSTLGKKRILLSHFTKISWKQYIIAILVQKLVWRIFSQKVKLHAWIRNNLQENPTQEIAICEWFSFPHLCFIFSCCFTVSTVLLLCAFRCNFRKLAQLDLFKR